MSVQFYIHDNDEMRAYGVFRDIIDPLRLSLGSMYTNYDADPNFGAILRDVNAVPFSNVIQPELFKRIWGIMVRMIEQWGAEQVLDFITSVYGVQVNIEVNPAMNIGMIANIKMDDTRNDKWVGNNKSPALRKGDTDYILARINPADYYVLFKQLVGDILSIEQLRILLQHLRPAGERWTITYKG